MLRYVVLKGLYTPLQINMKPTNHSVAGEKMLFHRSILRFHVSLRQSTSLFVPPCSKKLGECRRCSPFLSHKVASCCFTLSCEFCESSGKGHQHIPTPGGHHELWRCSSNNPCLARTRVIPGWKPKMVSCPHKCQMGSNRFCIGGTHQ